MVQLYNPNVVGKQILIDVKKVDEDKLKLIENIKPFMDEVVKEFNLNVVGQCEHQFEKSNVPYGVTMVYLLSESHLSIHTFVDENKFTLDLFTCNLNVEFEKLKGLICNHFGVSFLNIMAYNFIRGD